MELLYKTVTWSWSCSPNNGCLHTGEAENPIALQSMRMAAPSAPVWCEGLWGSWRDSGLWWKAEESGT